MSFVDCVAENADKFYKAIIEDDEFLLVVHDDLISSEQAGVVVLRVVYSLDILVAGILHKDWLTKRMNSR